MVLCCFAVPRHRRSLHAGNIMVQSTNSHATVIERSRALILSRKGENRLRLRIPLEIAPCVSLAINASRSRRQKPRLGSMLAQQSMRTHVYRRWLSMSPRSSLTGRSKHRTVCRALCIFYVPEFLLHTLPVSISKCNKDVDLWKRYDGAW